MLREELSRFLVPSGLVQNLNESLDGSLMWMGTAQTAGQDVARQSLGIGELGTSEQDRRNMVGDRKVIGSPRQISLGLGDGFLMLSRQRKQKRTVDHSVDGRKEHS